MFVFGSTQNNLAYAAAPIASVSGARSCIEYVAAPNSPRGEEVAGDLGKFLGAVVAIAIPFAAPAVWGALSASTALSSFAAGATSLIGGTMTNILGSAAVGAIMNAGIAYASGARGGNVWRAAGLGAVTGGVGGLTRGAPAARPAPVPGVGGSVGGSVGGQIANMATQAAGLVEGGSTVPGSSGSILEQGIRAIFGPNVETDSINKIAAAVINAAVNNQDMGRLNGLVAQQKRELDALAASNKVAYDQKIGQAQKIIQEADNLDPQWRALLAMADVAGAETHAANQAMRNIAVRQGGSLDAGQQKAYQRSSALHTARSKALAGNQAYEQARANQAQLRSYGAGLLGPDEGGIRINAAKTELLGAQERARREASASSARGFIAGLTDYDYSPATSPDPSSNTPYGNPYGNPYGS